VTEPSASTAGSRSRRPSVALLPAGDRFEDFHAKIGVSRDAFLSRLTGGWLFNDIAALASAGVDTALYFGSAEVEQPVRSVHVPTGATVWFLPTPRIHRVVRRATAGIRTDGVVARASASYVSIPMRTLARVIRKEGCDAILCQEYESERFDVAALLGRVLRLPVFAVYQGADRMQAGFERPMRRLALRSSAGVIVGASSEAERVRRVYGLHEDRIARIPNPIDAKRWRPVDRDEARRTLGIPPDARVVEWHGHVQVERKGLDVLVEAWRRLRATRATGGMLLLVGSGRNARALGSLIGSDPTVRWIDRYILDRAELWTYLAASDVYVLPSRHEGFAVAPLEAMAAARPVVATDVSGVRDLFPDGRRSDPHMGGIIVPPGDPGALAGALESLLADDDRARSLGAAGRRRAEREFDIEPVGRMLRSFLFGATT
jgi:glycosyltransferase involved in cell wall biosynthesis